jgi:AcrR family transcriptional regulator
MSTPEPRGRQRLSPAIRTDAILAAATESFAASPYNQVSVATVGRNAGTSEALIYKYFDTKPGLYAAVVKAQLDQLFGHQQAAIAALPPHTSARDLVRVIIETSLDQVSANATASPFFSPDSEPAEAGKVRQHYRTQLTDDLLNRLRKPSWTRGRIAIIGFLGFLGSAAKNWAELGCPTDLRAPLVETALGALEGALGDWDLLSAPQPR